MLRPGIIGPLAVFYMGVGQEVPVWLVGYTKRARRTNDSRGRPARVCLAIAPDWPGVLNLTV